MCNTQIMSRHSKVKMFPLTLQPLETVRNLDTISRKKGREKMDEQEKSRKKLFSTMMTRICIKNNDIQQFVRKRREYSRPLIPYQISDSYRRRIRILLLRYHGYGPLTQSSRRSFHHQYISKLRFVWNKVDIWHRRVIVKMRYRSRCSQSIFKAINGKQRSLKQRKEKMRMHMFLKVQPKRNRCFEKIKMRLAARRFKRSDGPASPTVVNTLIGAGIKGMENCSDSGLPKSLSHRC